MPSESRTGKKQQEPRLRHRQFDDSLALPMMREDAQLMKPHNIRRKQQEYAGAPQLEKRFAFAMTNVVDAVFLSLAHLRYVQCGETRVTAD